MPTIIGESARAIIDEWHDKADVIHGKWEISRRLRKKLLPKCGIAARPSFRVRLSLKLNDFQASHLTEHEWNWQKNACAFRLRLSSLSHLIHYFILLWESIPLLITHSLLPLSPQFSTLLKETPAPPSSQKSACTAHKSMTTSERMQKEFFTHIHSHHHQQRLFVCSFVYIHFMHGDSSASRPSS